MREESSGQELKIKEVDTRIEQEIAGLRTAIQASKVCLDILLSVGRGIDRDAQATTLQYIVGFGMNPCPSFGVMLILTIPCSDGLFSIAHGVFALPSMIPLSPGYYISQGQQSSNVNSLYHLG
jgi:hypothetical protein